LLSVDVDRTLREGGGIERGESNFALQPSSWLAKSRFSSKESSYMSKSHRESTRIPWLLREIGDIN